LKHEAWHAPSKGGTPYFAVELGRKATLKENRRLASSDLRH